jgi:hypothetical protein
MNKKILSLVLALVMVLGTFTTVFAEEAKTEKVEKVVGKENKIQYVIDKKFVEGYGDGDYGYDKNIKRSEITKLLVFANGDKELAEKLQGSMQLYKDVNAEYWANGVISVGSTVPSKANGIPMLNGYPDGTFKGENDVTYAELAKMLVVLVKEDLTADMAKEANKNWATQWMTWATQLGILDDVNVTNSGAAANRADAFTMVYNALYAMEYFHRTPVGEHMGIVSQLKNSQITLDQGEKAKTYKITDNTVFVLYNQNNTLDVNADVKDNYKTSTFTTAVKAKSISNPEYYYGSLVRVLANDKGEVTHILELGNPKCLAIGHTDTAKWEHTCIQDHVIDPNKRWNEVADATIETSLTSEANYRNTETTKYGVAAKINYKSGDAKSISFYEGMFQRTPINETGKEEYDNNYDFVDSFRANEKATTELKLTAKTRYYVADVQRNQLTEVKDVDEAIRILGNTTASNWFFDVYAGYDNFGDRKDWETAKNTNLVGYNEAKVVVFNAVQKDNNATQVLRVKNESTSQYNITFEDTLGKVIEKNVEAYRNYFPYNFNTEKESAKLDVIEFTSNNAFGIEAEMLIDHSDTDLYPIVKVTAVNNDGRSIVVEDKAGDSARLYLASGTDTFLEGQLKVGKLIQFRTLAKNNAKDAAVNDANYVNVVSVMPDRYDKGLQGSLQGVVEYNHGNQKVGTVSSVNEVTEFATNGYHKVTVAAYRDLYDGSTVHNASHFILNNTEALRLKAWLEKGHTGEEFRFKLQASTHPELKNEMFNIEVREGNNWVKLIDAKDGKLPEEVANEELAVELAKLKDNDTIKDLANDNLTQAAILAAAKTKVEDAVDTTKVDVAVVLVDAPAGDADYAANQTVKVKVTLTSKTVATEKVEKTLEGNVLA